MTDTFKDLCLRVDPEEVKRVIADTYDMRGETLDAHLQILDQLKRLKPEPSFNLDGDPICSIQVLQVSEEWQGEVDVWTDVSGLDAEGKSWAIEFTPWKQWLGLPVTVKGGDYTEAQIVAHCLYEMTFFGYEEEEIQEFASDLKDRSAQVMKDIESGDLSEYIELKPK